MNTDITKLERLVVHISVSEFATATYDGPIEVCTDDFVCKPTRARAKRRKQHRKLWKRVEPAIQQLFNSAGAALRRGDRDAAESDMYLAVEIADTTSEGTLLEEDMLWK